MPKLSGLIELRRFDIKDINPAKYNPRKDLTPDDPQYQSIRASLLEHGYIDPLVINIHGGANTVVGGHQRLKVLIAEGITEVDASVVDLATLSEEKALNIKLNNATGQNDEQKLAVLIAELSENQYDITTLGFDDQDLSRILSELDDKSPKPSFEDDFDADAEALKILEPVTQRGDIIELGRHRLLCGDSTIREEVEKLITGHLVQVVFTDPPYGMSYGDGRAESAPKGGAEVGNMDVKNWGMIKNDDLTGEALINMIAQAIKLSTEHTATDAAYYVCLTWRTYSEFIKAMQIAGLTPSSCIVWDKGSIELGYADYRPQHEFILYCAGKWTGDKAQSDVWNFSRENTGQYVHPTQKPIELVARALENSSKPGETVLDLFAGSGTTLMACEQLDRTALVIELDPVYCDVIVNRFEAMTNTKAVRPIAGGK